MWLLVAFSIWMLIDAIRRRAEFYWLFIILLLMPLGSVVYFFVVKVRDFAGAGAKARQSIPTASRTQPSAAPAAAGELDQLLDAADALEERESYDLAEPKYRQALEQAPNNLRALHGLGRCALGRGQTEKSAELLERVLERERSYRGYSAALDYAEALWQSGRKQDTIEFVEAMAGVTHRINHRVALAHYLKGAGRDDAARSALEALLADHQRKPAAAQSQEQAWAGRAERMLAELTSQSPAAPTSD